MEEVVEEEEQPAKEGKLGELLDYMASHVEQVLVGIALLTILFLVLLIILAVKLHNRNRELDSFYDEYGVDIEEEDEEEVIPEPRRKKVKKEKFDTEELDFINDFEEEMERRPVKKVKKKVREKEEDSEIEFLDL